jgi:hypothetical protein
MVEAWWYSQNRHTNSLDNLKRAATKAGDPKPRYDWNRFGAVWEDRSSRTSGSFLVPTSTKTRGSTRRRQARFAYPTQAGLEALQTLAATAGSGVSPVNVNLLSEHVPVAKTQTSTIDVVNQATRLRRWSRLVLVPSTQARRTLIGHILFLEIATSWPGKHHLSGRYSYSRDQFHRAGNPSCPESSTVTRASTRSGSFSATSSLVGPRTVNEFRAGYNRSLEDRSIQPPAPPGSTDSFGNYGVNEMGLFIGPIVNPNSRKTHLYQFSNNTSVAMAVTC